MASATPFSPLAFASAVMLCLMGLPATAAAGPPAFVYDPPRKALRLNLPAKAVPRFYTVEDPPRLVVVAPDPGGPLPVSQSYPRGLVSNFAVTRLQGGVKAELTLRRPLIQGWRFETVGDHVDLILIDPGVDVPVVSAQALPPSPGPQDFTAEPLAPEAAEPKPGEATGLRWAYYGALVLMGLTLLLMGLILLLRLRLRRADRRHAHFLSVWRPLLMQSLMEEPTVIPPMHRADWQSFMVMWNHMHDSLRGEAKESLNAFGRRIGLPAAALRLLEQRGMRRQLLAVMTLGNLQEPTAWKRIAAIAAGENSFLSLAAARALIRIDPATAVPLLLPDMARRSDWSPARVVTILAEAGQEAYAGPMVEAALTAAPDETMRLLRFMQAMNVAEAQRVVHAALEDGRHTGLLIAALPLAADPQDLDRVRSLCAHAEPAVRAEAAGALGRLGVRGDEARLEALLTDPQWAVRYKAAEALASLPFVGTAGVADLVESVESEQARDMLRHVLAEREAPC